MADGVYKRIEVIGSSPDSWEDAVENAVDKVAESIEDLRVCEVDKLDTKLEDNEVMAFRARVKISFKYQE